MIIKLLTSLGRRMDEHIKNFNIEIENIREYQVEFTELKNTTTQLKNRPKGINNRLDDTEEWVSNQKDK